MAHHRHPGDRMTLTEQGRVAWRAVQRVAAHGRLFQSQNRTLLRVDADCGRRALFRLREGQVFGNLCLCLFVDAHVPVVDGATATTASVGQFTLPTHRPGRHLRLGSFVLFTAHVHLFALELDLGDFGVDRAGVQEVRGHQTVGDDGGCRAGTLLLLLLLLEMVVMVVVVVVGVGANGHRAVRKLRRGIRLHVYGSHGNVWRPELINIL